MAALWSTKFNFENAFKPVSYRQWEAFKGDHIFSKVNHQYANHECSSISYRKPQSRSRWEDNCDKGSILNYIGPVPGPSQYQQGYPFASSETHILPAKRRRFSESNPFVRISRQSLIGDGVQKEKKSQNKINEIPKTSDYEVKKSEHNSSEWVIKKVPPPKVSKVSIKPQKAAVKRPEPKPTIKREPQPTKPPESKPKKVSPPKKKSEPKVVPPPKINSELKKVPPPKKKSQPKVVPPPKINSEPKKVPPPKKKSQPKVPPPKRKSEPKVVQPPKRKSEPKVIPKKETKMVLPPKRKSEPKVVLPRKKESEPKVIPPPKKEPKMKRKSEPKVVVKSPKKESEPKVVLPPKKESEPKVIPPPKKEPIMVPSPKRKSEPKAVSQPKRKSEPKAVPQPKKDSEPKIKEERESSSSGSSSTSSTSSFSSSKSTKMVLPPKRKSEPKVVLPRKKESKPKVIPPPKKEPKMKRKSEPKVVVQSPKKESEPKVVLPPKKESEPKVIPPPPPKKEPKMVPSPKRKLEPKVVVQSPKKESEPKVVLPPKKESEPKVIPPPKKEPKMVPPPKRKSEPKAVSQRKRKSEPKAVPQPKKDSEPKIKEESKSSSSTSSTSSFSSSESATYLEGDKAFEKLKKLTPPVVFLYGQPVKGVEIARDRYLESYTKNFKAVPIKMDDKIQEWSQLGLPETNPAILKQNKNNKSWQNEQERRKLIQYAVECSSRISENPQRTLTMKETLEMIKYAMVDSPQFKNGFIIDGFPGNLEEGMYYEHYFWPFLIGIQFLSTSELQDRQSTPPKFFRRKFVYNEKDIGVVAAHYGSKSIRVFGDENWAQEDDNYMNSMLDLYLQRPGTVPFSSSRKRAQNDEINAQNSFIGIHAPPITKVNALQEKYSQPKTDQKKANKGADTGKGDTKKRKGDTNKRKEDQSKKDPEKT